MDWSHYFVDPAAPLEKLPPHRAITDDRGSFEIGGVPDDGKPVRFHAMCGREYASHVFRLEPENLSPVWTLEKKAVLRVRAKDTKGAPVKEFEVALRNGGGWIAKGKDGIAVLLTDKKSGELRVEAKGYLPEVVPGVSLDWGEEREIEVRLRKEK